MKLPILIQNLTKLYSGLVEVNAWGETSLFYNPNGLLKRGTYCFTFKEKDGDNDFSSALNREEVEYRMNFKINKPTFLSQFNEPSLPLRPSKGNIITLKSGHVYDPTVLNTLIPHPVYGWMGWVSIINPSEQTIQDIVKAGLLDESYEHAKAGYNKNQAVKKSEAALEAGLSRQTKRKEDANSVNEKEHTPVNKKNKPN